MAKIHAIEKCIQCGTTINPLIPDNYKDLIRAEKIVGDFYREFATKDLKNPCLCFTSGHSVVSDASDISYFLCAKCCRILIREFLLHLMRIYKDILFQKFDKIKEELRNERQKDWKVLR